MASTLPKELRLVRPDEIDLYTAEFQMFHARLAHAFVRSEPREASRQYLRGLLAPVARKNCWQMAEAMGQKNPRAMQRLLFGAEWDADAVRDELQAFVIERFGEADGIGAGLDEYEVRYWHRQHLWMKRTCDPDHSDGRLPEPSGARRVLSSRTTARDRAGFLHGGHGL